MGNGVAKLNSCCAGPLVGEKYDAVLIKPDDLGHSFCYVRPDPTRHDQTSKTTTFRSISGASVSANPSTALSTTALTDLCPCSTATASAFESSDCFASLPLQPVPRVNQSGPVCISGSGPIERGFMSGPIERRLYSGPIEKKGKEKEKAKKSFSHRWRDSKPKSKKKFGRFKSFFLSLISSKSTSWSKKSMIKPINGSDSVNESDSDGNYRNTITESDNSSATLSGHVMSQSTNEEIEGGEEEEEEDCGFSMQGKNLQWALGKAGEDRVHVVVSEENGLVFVGIYDGFNGPDAPDYLLNYLYAAVRKDVEGLLWNDKVDSSDLDENFSSSGEAYETQIRKEGFDSFDSDFDKENRPVANREIDACDGRNKMWKCKSNKESSEPDKKLKNQSNNSCQKRTNEISSINHTDVLQALWQALKKTEDAYLEAADKNVLENPELALMGSCILVMLMKGEDIYLMNVGDSRAVLAQKAQPKVGLRKKKQELERIKEESLLELEATDDVDRLGGLPSLIPLQLTEEHSTRIEEEVRRIRKEHPDDASAVENERVKGYLKVTRAFGAGFLKQPKWNDALLEMFRIDYVGTSPYITCSPSLHHHRLTLRDKFLILSSDGLYEYFSNEEVVFEVESFIAAFPEGDPAQHLIEEVLFRAAKKFGMDFHELLEIPQGDRRRYHDDVSVIIISLEGRIWKSSM